MVLWSLLLLSGCATHGGSGGGGAEPVLQSKVRAEMARQYAVIGEDPALARSASVRIHLCPSEGTDNALGGWSCKTSCTRVDGCIHAWNQSEPGSAGTEFLFVEPVSDLTISHEVGHNTLIRFCQLKAGGGAATGHPATFWAPKKGRQMSVKGDLLARGSRWPQFVNAFLPASKHIVPPDPWATDTCGTGRVE
jgi:hypothetical protein